MTDAQLCKACGKVPASTANCGRAGSAMLAGMCYQCWKAQHAPAPPASQPVALAGTDAMAHVLGALEGLLVGELTDEARLFVEETEGFIGRVHARISEIRRRRAQLSEMLARIEKRATEAAAELRREVKHLRGTRLRTCKEISALPRSAAERHAERDAARAAREAAAKEPAPEEEAAS